MMKTSVRALLFLTGLLAAYQIAIGVEGRTAGAATIYTIGFGTLLVAGVLLIFLGFEILGSPWVVIVSTLIPISLALGLIWELLPALRTGYLAFALVGMAAVILTRAFNLPGKPATIVLAIVHGIAGLTIFLLPVVRSIQGMVPPGFALVGLGGALISLGGLLLSFLKAGTPLLSGETILKLLPALLLLMMAAFVAGFAFA